MDLFGMVLWLLGLIFSFILGLFTNWYFDRKQHRQNKANAEVLKQLRQYAGAQIRLGDDKRGKIVERPDGTIALDWTIELKEPVTVSATPRVEVEKKKE
jgi:type II secretory pathway pseudopilin PulG